MRCRATSCRTSSAKWSLIMLRGTLPLRKPGSLASRCTLPKACSQAFVTTSGVSSTCRRRLHAPSSSTSTFMAAPWRSRYGPGARDASYTIRQQRQQNYLLPDTSRIAGTSGGRVDRELHEVVVGVAEVDAGRGPARAHPGGRPGLGSHAGALQVIDDLLHGARPLQAEVGAPDGRAPRAQIARRVGPVSRVHV